MPCAESIHVGFFSSHEANYSVALVGEVEPSPAYPPVAPQLSLAYIAAELGLAADTYFSWLGSLRGSSRREYSDSPCHCAWSCCSGSAAIGKVGAEIAEGVSFAGGMGYTVVGYDDL